MTYLDIWRDAPPSPPPGFFDGPIARAARAALRPGVGYVPPKEHQAGGITFLKSNNLMAHITLFWEVVMGRWPAVPDELRLRCRRFFLDRDPSWDPTLWSGQATQAEGTEGWKVGDVVHSTPLAREILYYISGPGTPSNPRFFRVDPAKSPEWVGQHWLSWGKNASRFLQPMHLEEIYLDLFELLEPHLPPEHALLLEIERRVGRKLSELPPTVERKIFTREMLAAYLEPELVGVIWAVGVDLPERLEALLRDATPVEPIFPEIEVEP